ncbi:MAG TPA: anti-sigma factor antagonist [Acidimicrobiia bacterium]|nr:anti-sigma factor antagonist [Acidimicrobiia bacterium]
MPDAHLPVRIRSQGDAVIVSVSGELDLASVPIFMEAIEKAIAPEFGGRRLVLDLLDLSFMDSSGLGAILALQERHPGTQLALVVGEGIVERVLETTAMHKLLRIVPSVAEALVEG